MEALLDELLAEVPAWDQMVRVLLRLAVAMLLGGVIGLQRERSGKPAGLRTHMLVSLGAALFVLACAESGMDLDGLSRVVQGLATGIGFIGAGAILKLPAERQIEGLTTAAGIWVTAATGMTVGLGRAGIALLSILMAWIALAVIVRIEDRHASQAASEADAARATGSTERYAARATREQNDGEDEGTSGA